MRRCLRGLCVLSAWACLAAVLPGRAPAEPADEPLRPPAVPLVACDPYFSIWSAGDRLTDVPTTHWTKRPHRLTSLVRIDGKTYRAMGDEPASPPALKQTRLEVLPARTLYEFEGGGVRVGLTFMTPALPDDLELLARPVTYLTWEARATDDKPHAVAVYFDVAAELVVDEPSQEVAWTSTSNDRSAVLSFGSVEQPVLRKKGDNRRIDWGWLHVAAPREGLVATAVSSPECRQTFAATGTIPKEIDPGKSRAAKDAPVAAVVHDLGKVGAKPASCWIVLAYDDLYSIQYFRKNLRPYWKHKGGCWQTLLGASLREYEALRQRCTAFDEELMGDLRAAGGEKYARICALCYRQCLAGNKLAADANGQPLLFPKENTSNGCIGTVDVFYPMAPQFLLFGPSLAKAMLVPSLDYASSPRWRWPFAPHDLGTYPHADAQVYGGGERTEENQMPVEETGNMLILVAAVAKMEGNADFAAKYWPTLQKWAEFLKAKGFDPENQLCTDDFLGHLAHNTNLSIKATLGLASFAYLCELRGDKETAAEYRKLAEEFAQRWVKEADDGDHFRLAFDKPGTWSQKYNLVWDKILGFNLFPDSIRRKEMAFYRKKIQPFGLPLDNRGDGAKLDWSLWTATLTGEPADFDALAAPVYRFLHETPDRVGAGDWYNTANGRHIGMHSRPVVGGVFLKLLYDPAVWKKWASRDRTKAAGWAPLPQPPKTVLVAPTSEKDPVTWRWTTSKPAGDWAKEPFDDSGWKQGPGGFGVEGTPGAVVRTTWNTREIWLRREFTPPECAAPKNLHVVLHHDEDAEVYLNGELVLSVSGYTTAYEVIPLGPKARATLRSGKNVLAVHCRQTTGGQYIDAGLADLVWE